MQFIINLPNREETLQRHRQRWQEIDADVRWRDIPERIETNANGQIIMTPPPAFIHSRRQFRIANLLDQLLGGFSVTECGIITSDGIKVVDAGWYSRERVEQLGEHPLAELPPEICVEILSPSNTESEMKFKRALYFQAGAIECWQCNLEGSMSYFRDQDLDTIESQSILCPDFPSEISY